MAWPPVISEPGGTVREMGFPPGHPQNVCGVGGQSRSLVKGKSMNFFCGSPSSVQ